MFNKLPSNPFLLSLGQHFQDLDRSQFFTIRPSQPANNIYWYVRKLMALPFLPEGEIRPMFEQLQAQAATDLLKQFAEYISETWINSITWPPSCWSVFQMTVRQIFLRPSCHQISLPTGHEE